ncbi:cytochrome P450 [Mycena albidolilacea]|uniref:Cytochrome P450 n=1 Tax=Mycena albidolilacea TaxID=1033008 RepID=A0AAD7EYF9_9AGAR|nr:cytochrome P450 [Mycena albidolilacea]
MVSTISLLGRDLKLENVTPASALLVVGALWVLRRILTVVRILATPTSFPRVHTAFEPLALPGALIPTTWWTTGVDWHWARRFQTYTRGETVALTPIFLGTPGLWTSNIEVGRQVIAGSHKTSFYKPPSASQALLLWGMNLIASDGQMWRKHRRIVGPAFNNELYKLVWKQTAQIYRDMVQTEGWDKKSVVDVPIIQNLTLKLAFLIMTSCGFGFDSTWATPPKSKDNEMPVQEALRVVADTHMLMITAPEWVLHLPIPKFTTARLARDRLAAFMQKQVAERKAEVAAGNTRADAFTMLVKANQDESSKYQLDDQELIGNVFVLLFAGHETTAHTLAGTLGFMAIHDDIQDEIVEHIISVVGTDREPEFEDYSKLDKVLAIFYESARMFPAGHVLIREALEDTIVTVPNPVGEEGSHTVPIPKGTQVVVDMIGVQHNPRYFENPEEYKPSRWYGLPADSELFTAFSVGPRACIGRRFATVEATCFLALLLRDWKVLPVLRDGETKEAWGARMMDANIVLTLGVHDIPLRFERRKHA